MLATPQALGHGQERDTAQASGSPGPKEDPGASEWKWLEVHEAGSGAWEESHTVTCLPLQEWKWGAVLTGP